VRLRPPEQCKSVADIEWEIVNAGAVRAWKRAELLFLLLKQTDQISSALFHEAYGHFLVQAAFGDYGAEDGGSESELLSQWSVAIVDRACYSDKRHSGLISYELTLEMPMIGVRYDKSFELPPGRSIELLRDAKNELEKARDADATFRPWLSCALARCCMALGEYPQAAAQYRLLVDVAPLHLAWLGLPAADLRSIAKSRLAEALELGGADAELEAFLKSWIKEDPERLPASIWPNSTRKGLIIRLRS
jgi:tetratricopeptide (TPR) repeat protein